MTVATRERPASATRVPSRTVDVASGRLDGNSLYTLPEFCRSLQLSRSAFRALERQGLPVLKFGKRKFLLSADVICWLREQGPKQSE